MALRAFQTNPSIGGFGSESLFGQLPGPCQFAPSQSRNGCDRPDAAGWNDGDAASRTARRRPLSQTGSDPAKNSGGTFGAGSCDAFAQIVKELVDNAVDACAHAESEKSIHSTAEQGENVTMKRVRVAITSVKVPVTISSVEVPVQQYANGEGPGTSANEDRETMDCLRIEISDNGCGMDDIDECVTAFHSDKNGTRTKSNSRASSQKTGEGPEEDPKSTSSKIVGDKKQKHFQKQISSDSSEKYTSGRYGVGLTLCLLHAQRLCPGTGACITSATASANEWTRATYEPDTSADNIVCKKKDRFPKDFTGECGTTISLLVPGGENAQRAWPRLAEYFARFQLSIDLPCSLEVKAPTLQSMPLYVRPPSEVEMLIKRRRKGKAPSDTLVNETNDANTESDENPNKMNWKGGDGFDEGRSPKVDRNRQEPKTSKAAQQRAEAELQQKKKTRLICSAASAYKGRPGLTVENVAYATQPIRRTTGSDQSSFNNGPMLEISFIVFGPEPDAGNDSENESYPHQNDNSHSDVKNTAKLQLVRMVNGIPLLDSSEALACGVVQKIANNFATWNSFGLNISQNSDEDLDPVHLNTLNTPTFEVKDSDQVAPFLKNTPHSLFQGKQRQDMSQSSSDDDDFDIENTRGKRKKERRAKSILPACQRLGDVLMVVQIRAKPSALPLPTLSKGRLPLNDKGINDALQNGIAECLRSLQRSSPGLLLTAHQLKRVERDVKYIPSVAGAISSILCKQRGVYDNAMNITSGWDDEVKRMGVSLVGVNQRRGKVRSTTTESNNDRMNAQANEDRERVDAFRSILERRLRFVISDEFKNLKKSEEKEKQRKEREEIAAAKKRTKKSKAAENDGMKSDCFESDRDDSMGHPDAVDSVGGRITMESSHNDFNNDMRSPERSRGGFCKRDFDINSEQQIVAGFQSDHRTSFGDDFDSDTSSPVRQPSNCYRKGSCIASGLDLDSDMSGPTRQRQRYHMKASSFASKEPSAKGSQAGHKKPSRGDLDSDASSAGVHAGPQRWKQNAAVSSDDPQQDRKNRKTSDDLDSDTSSPVALTRRSHRTTKPDVEFDDGYESSPRTPVDRFDEEIIASNNVRGPRERFELSGSPNVGFHSDGSRLSALSPIQSASILALDRLESKRGDSEIRGPRYQLRHERLSDVGYYRYGSGPSTHSRDKSALLDDGMSSESEWSSQYGEVVPGHFFR